MATLQSAAPTEQTSREPLEIEAPASTSWPLILAFGFTLMGAGLLTSASVSVLGTVLLIAGCAGWFREVFPSDHSVVLRVIPAVVPVMTPRLMVDRIPGAQGQARAWLPLHTHPISAGL